MPPRRRVPVEAGLAAVRAWREAPGDLDRTTLATAVRFLLEELAEKAPGRSVEVRVPPFGAVQCVEGTTHRRGTPPAVVEMPADEWMRLALGRADWSEISRVPTVSVSGERTDLSALLPLL